MYQFTSPSLFRTLPQRWEVLLNTVRSGMAWGLKNTSLDSFHLFDSHDLVSIYIDANSVLLLHRHSSVTTILVLVSCILCNVRLSTVALERKKLSLWINKNKTNHPILSNSHPSATAKYAIFSLKIGGGGLQNQQEHHIILTKYEAVHPTAVSENNSKIKA